MFYCWYDCLTFDSLSKGNVIRFENNKIFFKKNYGFIDSLCAKKMFVSLKLEFQTHIWMV